MNEPEFQQAFQKLLTDYVGRPTPLFLAERLSEKYGAKIYLKREDLCHTGAHKINNTIGQILLAERLGKKRIIAETGAGQHGVATATVCALKPLSQSWLVLRSPSRFSFAHGEGPSSPISKTTVYRALIDHNSEQAVPGYYQAALDSGIVVRLAAETRTGIGEFDFPANSSNPTSTVTPAAFSSAMPRPWTCRKGSGWATTTRRRPAASRARVQGGVLP